MVGIADALDLCFTVGGIAGERGKKLLSLATLTGVLDSGKKLVEVLVVGGCLDNLPGPVSKNTRLRLAYARI